MPDLKDTIAAELEAARRRSLGLLDPLADELLVVQHSPIMSPLVWDLAHVGNYEEQWLLGAVAGIPTTSPEIDDMYNAFEHPRAQRPTLPLLRPDETRRYIANVRGRALDVLEKVELDPAQPLLREGFVYGIIAQHEHWHDETMLATLQLMAEGYRPPLASGPETVAPASGEVLVPGGAFTMGTDLEPWAFDNERPAHTVDVAPFLIDRAPVTNRAYMEFIAGGGYEDRRHWSEEGWAWRTKARASAPGTWISGGEGSWSRDRFGWVESVPLDEPVQHVSFYEAEAFARWAGKRLPTEAEWEKAASWTPEGTKLRFPWGNDDAEPARANLQQDHFGPAPVGSYTDGTSPWGCHQMIGDVWEWTSSDFLPYPGFRSFPYAEYSEVFFGPKYRVLRGGSWATHRTLARATLRSWDFPVRRQIFVGFRCARDA